MGGDDEFTAGRCGGYGGPEHTRAVRVPKAGRENIIDQVGLARGVAPMRSIVLVGNFGLARG